MAKTSTSSSKKKASSKKAATRSPAKTSSKSKPKSSSSKASASTKADKEKDKAKKKSAEARIQKTRELLADRRKLADQYLPYVRSIAGKVKKSVAKEIDFDDLVEYGMIGLLEAADRYDPEFGANFMTFAYYRIRGAIYDGLRGMGWMSRTEYAKARYEERANEYLAEMTYQDEMKTTGSDNPFEHAVQDLASAVQGLAAVYITTIDGTEGIQIEDEESHSQEESLGLEQARELVRNTITKLSEQERQLLEMYYYQEMSLQEVGEKLGLSKSWTSRLHARVIEKLHRLLEDSLGD